MAGCSSLENWPVSNWCRSVGRTIRLGSVWSGWSRLEKPRRDDQSSRPKVCGLAAGPARHVSLRQNREREQTNDLGSLEHIDTNKRVKRRKKKRKKKKGVHFVRCSRSVCCGRSSREHHRNRWNGRRVSQRKEELAQSWRDNWQRPTNESKCHQEQAGRTLSLLLLLLASPSR